VAVDAGAGTLQVYNAHLGTALLERRYQATRLAAWIHDRRIAGPKLLLGDFNEWSRTLAGDILAERLNSIDVYPFLKRRRTYPGIFPLLHLDHIYYEGDITVRQVSLPRNRLALLASDHLPLVADLTLRVAAPTQPAALARSIP
jgi:endonuclease/exonuclease/phosphatase family metal-dependent hydrolase